MNQTDTLTRLGTIDFTGKSEAFVESRFLSPLLELLGYETHKDYEVLRHGDEGASFKLKYPPVERGAVRVKPYNTDYAPTIRKKLFWIIEAKSPKDVEHPFEARYLVQGLQYCIHPEIQAQYLVVSNGVVSSVFDAHGAVFLDKDIYEPILEFRATELPQRWPEVYALLGVERLRSRIEEILKSAYDKLCLSSLDEEYPRALLARVGTSCGDNAQAIYKRVIRMNVEHQDADRRQWLEFMEGLDSEQAYTVLDDPMQVGPVTQVHFFLKKSEAQGRPHSDILTRLTNDYESQSLFRKEQSFLGVCLLYLQTSDAKVMTAAKAFLDRQKDADLPLLNQVECVLLRLTRKQIVLKRYPHLRETISRAMQTAPELVRFVNPPSPLGMTYSTEIQLHHQSFVHLLNLPASELQRMLESLLHLESTINDEFWKTRRKLADSEVQLLGLETYGVGGRHYFFRGSAAQLRHREAV